MSGPEQAWPVEVTCLSCGARVVARSIFTVCACGYSAGSSIAGVPPRPPVELPAPPARKRRARGSR